MLACIGQFLNVCPLAAETPSPSASPADELLGEVLVTGSRLPVFSTDTAAPVIVLSRGDLERGGKDSLGKILQSLPMKAGSPLNTNVNAPGSAEFGGSGDAGDGSVRFNLHGHSTLVLLNGRRLPNSGLGADASVDLNTLPLSLIDRVEVLASGASAVYGADAVGGVVNIVTRRDTGGLELGGSRTITEHGDGEILTGQAAFGFDLLGGSWSLGLDYAKQDGVTLDRRSYSALPLLIVDDDGTVAAVGGNNATPEGRFQIPAGNALGLEPGFYTRMTGATGQTAAGFDHLLQATIVDAEGKIYRQLYGDSFAAPQFVGPLVELVTHAPRAAGDLAALLDQVKLLCTVYDPAAGRYRVNYAILIEILVGASIFLIGIPSLVIEWRRRRKAQTTG